MLLNKTYLNLPATAGPLPSQPFWYSGRNTCWPAKMIAELADEPNPCTCVGKARQARQKTQIVLSYKQLSPRRLPELFTGSKILRSLYRGLAPSQRVWYRRHAS